MKESVLGLKDKHNTILDLLLSNCPQELNIVYDWPVKYLCTILIHDYSIRIEFSCLYIPQGHYVFVPRLWVWSIDEYVEFWFLTTVHLKHILSSKKVGLIIQAVCID